MSPSTYSLRLRPQIRLPQAASRFIATTPTRQGGIKGSDWEGRQSDEHIINSNDNLNIHVDTAQAAKADRNTGIAGDSSATTERDPRASNEQAQKDHPEAPGPVLGMNDERGGKGETAGGVEKGPGE